MDSYSDSKPPPAALLEAVPDRPRCVEARALLLAGRAVVGSPAGGVVLAPGGRLLCLFGRPREQDLREALRRRDGRGELLACAGTAPLAQRVLGRPGELAAIHTAIHPAVDLAASAVPVRVPAQAELLTSNDDYRLAHLPENLRREITRALAQGPVAAAIVEHLPVSFCYPAAVTETYWDVSVDTLEAYRRRGLAALAFHKMAARMSLRARRPVWGAVESNRASLALARRLGFQPVDRLYVWNLEAQG